MRRDEARLGEVRRDEAGCSENAARCLFCSKMSYVVWLLVLPAHGLAAQSSHTSQLLGCVAACAACSEQAAQAATQVSFGMLGCSRRRPMRAPVGGSACARIVAVCALCALWQACCCWWGVCSVCSAALACDARVLCACACWILACVCVVARAPVCAV